MGGDVNAKYNDWTPVVDDDYNMNLLFYYNMKTKACQSDPPHFSVDVNNCARRHFLANQSNQHNQGMWDCLCKNAALIGTSDDWEEWKHKETKRTFFRHTKSNWYEWADPQAEYAEEYGYAYEERPEE